MSYRNLTLLLQYLDAFYAPMGAESWWPNIGSARLRSAACCVIRALHASLHAFKGLYRNPSRALKTPDLTVRAFKGAY